MFTEIIFKYGAGDTFSDAQTVTESGIKLRQDNYANALYVLLTAELNGKISH